MFKQQFLHFVTGNQCGVNCEDSYQISVFRRKKFMFGSGFLLRFVETSHLTATTKYWRTRATT